jgi:hypothetical protein
MRLIGCLGLMALASFFIGNFRQMIQAVFPLSIFALQLGATLGIMQNPTHEADTPAG